MKYVVTNAHTGSYFGTYDAESADEALLAMVREYGNSDDVPDTDAWIVRSMNDADDARAIVLDQAQSQVIDPDLFPAVVNKAARAVWFDNVPVHEAIEQAAIKLGA